TFRQLVQEAREHINILSPQDAKQIIDQGGVTVIDVREPWEIAQTGTIPGARNITRGELEIKADTELPRRDAALQDRSQKIILTCGAGGKATLCAKALHEMGFTDVWIIDGGCRGWKEAGYQLAPPHQ
ncbi:MAG TPA: rhodanese-like domain-containing protein, partial [Roseiflexaceae bacterium]